MKIAFHYSPPGNGFQERLHERCEADGRHLYTINGAFISWNEWYHPVPGIGDVESSELIDLAHLVEHHDVVVFVEEWDCMSSEQHRILAQVLKDVQPKRVVCRMVHGRIPPTSTTLEDVLS